MMTSHKDAVRLAKTLLPLSKHEDKRKAKLRIINYDRKNTEQKILKRKKLGTVNIPCTKCDHKKVWRNGFEKRKNIKYPRFKCPICKTEFYKKVVR